MIARWGTDLPHARIVGQHKPGQMRQWLVTLTLRNKTAYDKVTLEPRIKCSLMALQEIILEAVADFEAANGECLAYTVEAAGR